MIAAVLRNLLTIEGDVALVIALQGLFNPSAGAAGDQVAGYAGRPQ